jgi:hypothetical protein
MGEIRDEVAGALDEWAREYIRERLNGEVVIGRGAHDAHAHLAERIEAALRAAAEDARYWAHIGSIDAAVRAGIAALRGEETDDG